MSIFIEKLDGTLYDLTALGVRAISFDINSPSPRFEIEEVAGRDGHFDTGVTFEGRTIQASFELKGSDRMDYLLLRDEIFKLFAGRELFYLIDENEPRKRWKVRATSPYVPTTRGFNSGIIDVTFQSPFPYAESRGTTLDPLTFDAEKWQVGQGLTLEENGHPKYVHSTAVFMYYNAGDVAIDPRELPLKITYRGASNKLKITNSTNGDVWQHNGSSLANDTITLDGIQSFKNGLTIFGQTNRKLITIDPGWNLFTLTGYVGAFLISFEHRFYYF